MTRIQGTTETLSDISELSSILQSEQPTDNRVSELSSIIQSEQLADNSDLLEKVKEKVGLRVLYSNVDSLQRRKDDLQAMINKYAPEIICLVEIFPKTANFIFAENEYNIKGYNAFITDSKKRGAIILVKDNLLSSANQLTQHIFEESVWCEIRLKNHDKLLLGCIYRSPNSDPGNNGELINLLREASKKRISLLLIVGDFNCKDIDWESANTQMSPRRK